MEAHYSFNLQREKDCIEPTEIRTDEGEQVLTAGMCAGFPAGSQNGHHFLNRSDRPARYLEIGSRDPADTVGYSEVDLACSKNSEGAWVFTKRDGSTY